MGPAPKALERWTRMEAPPMLARMTMRTVWLLKLRGGRMGGGVGGVAGGVVAAPAGGGVGGRTMLGRGTCWEAVQVATQWGVDCAEMGSETASARTRVHNRLLSMGTF